MKKFSVIGNTQAHKLFKTIIVKLKDDSKPARAFTDYEVTTTTAPSGVTGTELV